ncbi:dockerin type I domain-containing protein [Porcipelethomonas sp.]|uniref:dockerin type I domain-containing protein n=1 Tax=Porcipelethomonas sp. TaxID=2981675 RepID=UPI003EF1B95F
MKVKKVLISGIAVCTLACSMAIQANAVTYVAKYDVNHDNVVNVRDVAYINRILQGTAKPTSIDNLDANGNGVVDDIDMQTILYHVTGKTPVMTMQ